MTTRILSELCQNHGGDMKVLRTMVERSGEFGAWGCKIQTFFADDLSDGWKKKDYDRIKGLEVSMKNHERFIDWCTEANVVPVTSVYSSKYLPKLRDMGFKWIKIGSAQNKNRELISDCFKNGFRVIISTGGTDPTDLPEKDYSAILHCVSKYPTSPYETNLARMLEIQILFERSDVGFSSHVDPVHPKWGDPLKMAMTMGAKMIEVHYTIKDRKTTKDGPVSLDDSQLKELCRWGRMSWRELVTTFPFVGMIGKPKDQDEVDTINAYRTRWL